MSSASISSVILVLSLFISAFFLVRKSRRSSIQNFPPGPAPLPLIGNLHQMPKKNAYLQFEKWSYQYGKIVGLRIGSQKLIILSSWRAVRDLFDQRGAIYSSRPHVPAADYVVPDDAHVTFMKYDRNWRRGRAMITNFLKDEVMEALRPIQDAESTQMVWEVLRDPERYQSHIMRLFCAVILASVYGKRGQRHETDEFFAIQSAWASVLEPGAFPPLDVAPWLKFLPSGMTPWPGWRQQAEDVKRKQRNFYMKLFQEARETAQLGKKKDMFAAKMLDIQEKDGLSDTELSYIAGFMIEAGADTNANTTLVFIMAMAVNPEVQRKAQSEVDSIFTTDKMPQSAVIENSDMPYLHALFWEVLRWRPSLPLSIPHATTEDDTYGEYFIPAGTTVLMNTWAIQHDPDEYPDPDIFDPSRFLNNEFGTAISSQDNASRRKTYAFGAARRVCAGSAMAERSVLLSMAKLLWAFDITPAGGGTLDTNVETAFRNAILTGPKDVGMNFKLRDERKRDVVEREWGKADAFLSTFE